MGETMRMLKEFGFLQTEMYDVGDDKQVVYIGVMVDPNKESTQGFPRFQLSPCVEPRISMIVSDEDDDLFEIVPSVLQIGDRFTDPDDPDKLWQVKMNICERIGCLDQYSFIATRIA